MNIKILFVIIVSIMLIGSGGQAHTHDLPLGGRTALHGMVVYGAGPYFLDHIPMLHPPHDFQIIAEVILTDQKGNPVKKDFSTRGFTFKPNANFSLNNYISGELKTFEGSIHNGGFEQDGPTVEGLDKVSVVVKELKLVRQLPAASSDESFDMKDGKNNLFRVNVITPSRNFQLIKNEAMGKLLVLWCVEGPDFFDPCTK